MSSLVFPSGFPFDEPSLVYRIDPMQASDLRYVMPIERVAFPSPWPASAYRYELTQNDLSTYLVLRLRHLPHGGDGQGVRGLWAWRRSPPVLGYGGFWMIVDESHISTLAVHPDWRGRGLGEMLLVALIEASILRGAAEATLEVRVSNVVAQNLYRKYGFVQVGRRKGYYHDNHEDALIMTTPRLDEARFAARYQELETSLRKRLAQQMER
jgi:ribosomal-protein-alanine N-acetyltransferase